VQLRDRWCSSVGSIAAARKSEDGGEFRRWRRLGSCVVPKPRKRRSAKGGADGGGAGGGREGGGTRGGRGRYTHRGEKVGIAASHGGKTHAGRRRVRGRVREGGSRSLRGRTRASTTRTRARARPRAYARGIYTRCCNASVCTVALEAHSARARCSIDCGRASTAGSLVIRRRSYGGGIMSSRSCVGKIEEE